MQVINYHEVRAVLAMSDADLRALLTIWRGPVPYKRGGRCGPAVYAVEELVGWLYKALPAERFNHAHELLIRQRSTAFDAADAA